MTRVPALLTALLLAATAVPAGAAPQTAGPVEVEVTRDGGQWTVDFVLSADAPVWVFNHSALLREARAPWRPNRWTVRTPGVILDRQGNFDVLRSVDGGPVPRRIQIDMRPEPGDLEADYDPSLVFSDGTVALYSDQFDAFPLESVEAVRALPLDLSETETHGDPATVTYRDRAGPVLFKGRRMAEATAADAGTYVLFGEARVEIGEGVTTVIDPALPGWLGQQLGDFTPRVMAFYASRLGPNEGGQPTLMVSWTGPTRGVTSMGGSVLPGMISMNFEGEGVLDPEPAALARARWFIGHEGAHFWLGSNGLRYARARDAWITEGGADLMAVRATRTIDPTYDSAAELQREVDDCIAMATSKPVASAGERGENRAYYACGAVWSLALEAAQRARTGGDFFDVVVELQRRNADDRTVTREEWLSLLTDVSGDPSLRTGIERMLDKGAANPAGEIAHLFERTGVAFRMEGDRLVLVGGQAAPNE